MEAPALDRTVDLSETERDEMRALGAAVYPPAEWANWPGLKIEWSRPEWWVRVRDDSATLVSCVGIVLRDATLDGRPARVGGIGGVKTHPAARRRGFAALGIARALELFRDPGGVDFGLLVCDPRLLPYYARLGWREFGGRLVVRQYGTPADFTFNCVMTCAVRAPAPELGTIDLMGPPW